jgi:alpha-1,3-rhamnosyltransferase
VADAQPPLVSVGVITYNHGRYIEACLRSVLEQDHPRIEVVVAEDGSTDDTLANLRRIAAHSRHPVKVLAGTPGSGGETAARNRLIPHLTGDLVVFLDGDDLLYPGKLSAQAATLAAHPAAAFAYHDTELFTDDPAGPRVRYSRILRPRTGGAATVVRNGGPLCPPHAVMYRRSAIPAGGYPPELPWASDWMMQVLAARTGPAVYDDRVLAGYRRHPGSSMARRDTNVYPYLTLALVEARFPELAGPARVGRARKHVASALRHAGDRRAAGAYARAALRLRPWWPPLTLAFLVLAAMGLPTGRLVAGTRRRSPRHRRAGGLQGVGGPGPERPGP